MDQHLLYTVYTDRPGSPVRFINRQTCHTGWFTGPFDDPGEASQEFQAHVGSTAWCDYLDAQQFPLSAAALIGQHRQARAAWHRWLALSGEQQEADALVRCLKLCCWQGEALLLRLDRLPLSQQDQTDLFRQVAHLLAALASRHIPLLDVPDRCRPLPPKET